MRRCPNCGSTAQVKANFIRYNEKGTISFWRYKCGCGCEFKDVPKVVNGKEVAVIEVMTELDTDRNFEVVVGENHISNRMTQEDAIAYVNRLKRLLPNKNIYYRIAK